ncbi:MAG: ABC transporter permease [Clostridium sp.]|uniref:ABC transporter permease n=1 Tax=Clostridium sp. TaxID=1506 RepID=UPI00303BCFA0
MQVFKQYFKIVRKSALSSLVIYIVIFTILTLMFSNMGGAATEPSFETSKCAVAVINNDTSFLSETLEKYIGENSKIVEINTGEEGIKDALFFRKAEVVITIPEGFGDSFITSTPYNLITQSIPNSSSTIFVKNMVNNYLTTTNLYVDTMSDTNWEEISKLVLNDLSINTKVTLSDEGIPISKNSINYYFNYLSYALISILILGISITSNIFNSPDIKRRNLCSPIKPTRVSLEIFLGNTTLAFVTWLFFFIFSIVMYKGAMFTTSGLLYGLNSLVFTMVCLSLSFLIGNIASKTAINPISNCVALGGCFLGGAFVPQNLLSETVKNIAVVNPVYWFIKINDKIGALSVFDKETLTPLLFETVILLAFAAAFLGIALVVIKQKRTKY